MLAVRGVYDNGKVQFQDKIQVSRPVQVIVTFLEDVPAVVGARMDLEVFSFRKAQEILKDYHGSLSDAIVEERRSAV